MLKSNISQTCFRVWDMTGSNIGEGNNNGSNNM